MIVTLTRRALVAPLCAVPVALIATEVGACTLKLETPVRRLYGEWQALTAVLDDTNYPMTEDELQAGCNERHRIAIAMMATPAEDAEDVLLKFGVRTLWGVFEFGEHEGVDWDDTWAEVRKLANA